MTGLERNADVVRLATYAPLFAHVDAWQWNPDLIWFDNLRMMRTPNYYVQQMYGMNAGTDVLNLQMDGKPVTGQDSLYASAVLDAPTGEVILKACQCGQQIGEGTDRVQRIEEAAGLSRVPAPICKVMTGKPRIHWSRRLLFHVFVRWRWLPVL